MSAKIPNLAIIDMGPYRKGGKEGRNKVAQEIYDAAHNVGFLYLKNFGMSEDQLEVAFNAAKSLFANDEKTRVPFSAILNHGYTAMKGEALDPSKPADLKESFTSRNLANIPSGSAYWPNSEFEALCAAFSKVFPKLLLM